MLSPIQNFFHYSRGERRGTLLLLMVIVLLLSWYPLREWFQSGQEGSANIEHFKESLLAFDPDANQSDVVNDEELFLFDPNLIGVTEWMQLGFTEKQAMSIENYKASGAVFKIKKDVLKLFMVDQKLYNKLEPFIDLPETYSSSTEFKGSEVKKSIYAVLLQKSEVPIYSGFENFDSVYYSKKDGFYTYCVMPFNTFEDAETFLENNNLQTEVLELQNKAGYYPIKSKEKNEVAPLLLDLNTADTTQLKLLKGIGSYYANKIVTYREQLGGFISTEQIMEIKGFKEETYLKIVNQLEINVNEIEKLNINLLDISELKKHPYISWNVANSIVQIRNNYGKFASIEDVKKSVLVDEALFERLKPYLTTE